MCPALVSPALVCPASMWTETPAARAAGALAVDEPDAWAADAPTVPSAAAVRTAMPRASRPGLVARARMVPPVVSVVADGRQTTPRAVTAAERPGLSGC